MSVVPALCVAMAVLGVDTSTVVVMAAAAVVAAALEIANGSYRTVVTDRAVHVQCGLRVDRILRHQITEVRVAPYRATEALVGRGVFRQSRDGRVRTFRAGGIRETVRITWDRGDGPRTTIIATDQPDALRGALSPPPRVRLDPEALAEADGLLLPQPREPRASPQPRTRRILESS
ncbi:MAG: hypothetical protein VYE22_13015 [Myxococcota bacterium]|nr:hypothetical protein [Myxococcota bacterium]